MDVFSEVCLQTSRQDSAPFALSGIKFFLCSASEIYPVLEVPLLRTIHRTGCYLSNHISTQDNNIFHGHLLSNLHHRLISSWVFLSLSAKCWLVNRFWAFLPHLRSLALSFNTLLLSTLAAKPNYTAAELHFGAYFSNFQVHFSKRPQRSASVRKHRKTAP
jgi:hypothetical protein